VIVRRPSAGPALLLLAGLALLRAGPAAAADADADRQSALHWFDLLDADHDGKLTLDEARNLLQRRFARIDADGDGSLTLEEYLYGLPKNRTDEAKRWTGRFTAMDADRDQRVTLQEEIAFVQRVIRNTDANHDGVLTREEFEAAISRK